MTHLVPLAKEVDENKVTPGVLGFIVFAAMALAVWALMKSMSKHMGKVSFEETAADADTPGSAPASAGGTSGTGTQGKASPANG